MKGLHTFLIFFFGALGGLLFGYDTGVISGAILFIQKEMHLSVSLEGWVVSAVLVGAIIGAGISGPLSEKFGRKWLIFFEGIIFCVGAIGSSLSTSAEILIAFRVFLGLAVGGASALVPVYLAEMAPAEIRGALTSLNQLMIVIGILVAYLVDFAFSASGQWRWMLGLGIVPALIMIIGVLFLPESPRWLIVHKREGEARKILAKLKPKEMVDAEIAEIKRMNIDQQEDKGDIFQPFMRPLLVVAVLLAMFQQVVGVNAVIYYAPTILTQAGFGTSASILGTIGIGVAQVIMVLVGMSLVDKLGRKRLLMMGNVLMSVSMIVMAIVLKVSHGGIAVGWTELICMTLFIAAFCMSWGPVMWVVVSEYLPLKYRGAGLGIASVGNWVANLIVSQSFPILLQAIGGANVFLIYAVMGVLAILFVKFFVVETKGRTLEQIEADFRKGSNRKIKTKTSLSESTKM
ncbi:sugar porter family MFS transporter [Neobacillus cucumis]|uniref:sugar porter family MFS transporter n=1 Tax=Neobacillus cucumis TaxID=1740721 RepID=UPI001FDB6973|nr:sugar porter (SP) family MFS transporter [Neobacillus cucumis]